LIDRQNLVQTWSTVDWPVNHNRQSLILFVYSFTINLSWPKIWSTASAYFKLGLLWHNGKQFAHVLEVVGSNHGTFSEKGLKNIRLNKRIRLRYFEAILRFLKVFVIVKCKFHNILKETLFPSLRMASWLCDNGLSGKRPNWNLNQVQARSLDCWLA